MALAFWAAALCLEMATRLHNQVWVTVGVDLPSPALLVRTAVQAHVPWAIAAVVTAGLAGLAWLRSPRLASVAAAAGALGVVMLALCVLSLSLPAMKCGWYWPDWDGLPSSPPACAK